jgi:hypothetical protein
MSNLLKPISAVVDPTKAPQNDKGAWLFHLARDPVLFPLLRVKFDILSTQQVSLDEMHKSVVTTALLETTGSDPGPLEPKPTRVKYDRTGKICQGGEPTRAQLLATTIGEFNAKTRFQQIAFLDQLWRRSYEAKTPDTLASAMTDNFTQFGWAAGQLTSSLRPVDKEKPRVGLKAGPTEKAWAKYQLGFRVDGGKGAGRDDLTRISGSGSQPLVGNTPLALLVVKKAYMGLAVSKERKIHFGYQNRDVYNESATCVSRTLIGATAFPYRETVTASDPAGLEFHYLFVCSCAGLAGCDTEQWQIDKLAQWRPGEKAFVGVPAENMLGWTRLLRHGQPSMDNKKQAGWAFEFVDCVWTWLRQPTDEIRLYLEGELGAWKPGQVYHVPKEYDFEGHD